IALTLFDDGADHLGNDLAALLDDDDVPRAHVAALDFLLVVERRHADRRPAEPYGLEHGVGRHGAGPSDIRLDADESRARLLGRKLDRDCPARELRSRAKPLAKREVVELDDDPVGVERQRATPLGPLLRERDDFVDTGAAPPVRLDGTTPLR